MIKHHLWENKTIKRVNFGYNRCKRCRLNKVYVDYKNGYVYYHDGKEKTSTKPPCEVKQETIPL